MYRPVLSFAIALVCFVYLNAPVKADNHGHSDNGALLQSVLDLQPRDIKARYQYRHPFETLQFFGIKPGMKVIEVLPGRGWYSKILLSYLGVKGELVGVDYAQDMWPHFSFADEKFIENKKTWVTSWIKDASAWRDDESARVNAFKYGDVPPAMKESADAVLFIRAFHNLARYDDKGGYLSKALKETFDVLKPGGLVGIVQHAAREDRPDAWASGNNGYLKKSFVMKAMKDHGFEFIGESAINENPKDQAGEGDIVWRLPPSLRGSKENSKERAAVLAIGESNRMTLKFQKPLK